MSRVHQGAVLVEPIADATSDDEGYAISVGRSVRWCSSAQRKADLRKHRSSSLTLTCRISRPLTSDAIAAMAAMVNASTAVRGGETTVANAADALVAAGAHVAISFLHADRNPAHEQRAVI